MNVFVQAWRGHFKNVTCINRVCTKLRQRLNPEHLHRLLLISIEGPELLSRSNLVDIV